MYLYLYANICAASPEPSKTTAAWSILIPTHAVISCAALSSSDSLWTADKRFTSYYDTATRGRGIRKNGRTYTIGIGLTMSSTYL